MSVTPLSDRKAMVNYAIDLLRAHQIRRENVFLHEQLKTCAKELATLRDEVRDLRANQMATVKKEIEPMKVSIDINAKKAVALMDRLDSQLNEQARELEQSHRAMQTETSNIRASCRKRQEDERAQRAVIEKQLEAVRTDCENLASVQQQQARRTLASLETLQSALDGKADVAVMEMLETRVNEFSTRRNAAAVVADSVSHISDTLERRCHPLEPGNHDQHILSDESAADLFAAGKLAQVQDSQHGNHEGPEPRETTVPDDLDLDANAHTISYAGHCYSEPAHNDSLKMLSPPTVEATQLAEIKTLRQRRFDGWDSYYNQGQNIVEALPRQFEGTIVHNFVNGLFKESHRKQCQQWLDSSGWTWANVTTFGNLCSQLFADNATKAGMDTETLVHPKGIGAVLAAVGKSGRDTGAAKSKKSSKGELRQVNVDVPLRRSQRVAEKQGLNAGHAGKQPELTSIQGYFAHRVERDKGQESKPKNQAGNECPKTQNRPQSDNPTERRAGMRESETAGVELPKMMDKGRSTKGTAVPTESRKSHKRKAARVEVGHYSKRLKSRSKARVGDDHAISIPQLVSFRGGIAKSVEESSNDEGFLYDGNLSKPSVSTTARQPRGHKKRRLPLPPPPEIPILPTTDEE
ncbi:uncharacterized protein Z519_07897 [Cladophialophora bantiana CBS 173.52]|uniref:Uncharacterized protein n=1 Tax=Cladophialophora bantiana (strain ATCC 10958 / CBS 173.52 / CDC B-1940 / NIH 8579) TaxID=1442370 RepID=A0A0D2FZN6_CLAB1|nr:uncharacterized protein Z519_07897 [Cladophialophora bantiana CBS 173.52]KIW91927.1 hypothetical protein Z519_07897 [Cladophialophora bantiana CBS 173.52]